MSTIRILISSLIHFDKRWLEALRADRDDCPLAAGKASLSVGIVLDLCGVMQFATPGVVPSMEFLEGVWLLLSVGFAATIGGLLQYVATWRYNNLGTGSHC